MSSAWPNVWAKKRWPYNELSPGDELYWYETPSKRIVWRSRVTQVEAFPYSGLESALSHLDEAFGWRFDGNDPYFAGKPDSGYFLACEVEALERLDVPKPEGLTFNQIGWERADRSGILEWLASK